MDVLAGMYYSLQKKQKPTLLGIAVARFNDSSWVEDLFHYGTVRDYLYHGKRG